MSSSQNSSFSSEALSPIVVGPLNDVVCRVDVILGSSTLSGTERLRLRRNSIIRLAQTAGEDMQVMVNGIALAAGEVVIIDDSTAIRLTDILAPPSSEGTE